MTPREVYLEAARDVAKGTQTFPCTAVYAHDGVNWHQPESLARKFILTMAPGRTIFTSPYAASCEYLLKTFHGLKGHSVLALCFMAAMENA